MSSSSRPSSTNPLPLPFTACGGGGACSRDPRPIVAAVGRSVPPALRRRRQRQYVVGYPGRPDPASAARPRRMRRLGGAAPGYAQ
uniref:Uncharacterized protein n=1 Tax=Leersia perrieri TaxID=77586 RepID=A0A0D9X3J7_9ORYZ